ncbi:Pancreatic secretory granule membrane major glycoprotein GP2 [Mizuhopecten yessoensis]|uniref:Pancreatic secretory granule membrane major glycoprotein GP2 n=1 Tax=Mizuhopecten yessoensis TaxID=6573 RepID=A0A210PRW7_MIZYE|nr:Pancreatic secretory granule membrane major glycoprotein GP2 [Mizuhopecten yessoensis]
MLYCRDALKRARVDFCFPTDPCISGSVPVLDVVGRSTNCPFYGKNGLCDASLTETWYRTDIPMTSTCPNIATCGTYYPVWLNGSEPTESEGMVNRTACMKGISGCCIKTYDVVLKNCSTFMAYCLQHLTGCAERYCFGDSGSCPTAPPTTKPTISTTSTTLSTPTLLKSMAQDNDQIVLNIAVIVVGIVAAILLIVCIGCILWTCSKRKAAKRSGASTKGNNGPLLREVDEENTVIRDVPGEPMFAVDNENKARGLERGQSFLPPLSMSHRNEISDDPILEGAYRGRGGHTTATLMDSTYNVNNDVYTMRKAKLQEREMNVDIQHVTDVNAGRQRKKKKKKKMKNKQNPSDTPKIHDTFESTNLDSQGNVRDVEIGYPPTGFFLTKSEEIINTNPSNRETSTRLRINTFDNNIFYDDQKQMQDYSSKNESIEFLKTGATQFVQEAESSETQLESSDKTMTLHSHPEHINEEHKARKNLKIQNRITVSITQQSNDIIDSIYRVENSESPLRLEGSKMTEEKWALPTGIGMCSEAASTVNTMEETGESLQQTKKKRKKKRKKRKRKTEVTPETLL